MAPAARHEDQHRRLWNSGTFAIVAVGVSEPSLSLALARQLDSVTGSDPQRRGGIAGQSIAQARQAIIHRHHPRQRLAALIGGLRASRHRVQAGRVLGERAALGSRTGARHRHRQHHHQSCCCCCYPRAVAAAAPPPSHRVVVVRHDRLSSSANPELVRELEYANLDK